MSAGTKTRMDPATSIRAIIRDHPHTAAVFDRHGLLGCGGPEGPDEPLGFFARAHHVPLEQLVAELGQAIATDPPRRSLATAGTAASSRPARFVPFFVMSLLLTMTFGVTLGMINLARLTGTGWGALSRPSVWAHGYVQVFGFVGLFVMGVAGHVIPRFLNTPLALSRLVMPMFWLQLLGVLAIAGGMIVSPDTMWPLWIGGAAALVISSVLFAATLIATIRGGTRPQEPFLRWIMAGAAWLIAVSVLAFVAALGNDTTWHAVLWPAALFGFAGSWIFGIGRRIFPVFLNWETRWRRVETPAFCLYQAGVVCWAVGAWPGESAVFGVVRAAGAGLLIASLLIFGRVIGLFARRNPGGASLDRGLEPSIYAAWFWFYVGLAAGPLWTLQAILRGAGESVVIGDFSRHAIAFGFVTQMIMGVASRVVPVFTGHRLWSPRIRAFAFWLINVSVAVRGLQVVVASGYWPEAWPAIALSGPPGVLAVLLFAINIIMTTRVSTPSVVKTPSRTVDLADRSVARLLEIPGALEALLDAGFLPLRNPAMRAAFASTVTLRQACRLRNVPLDPLVARIRALETHRTNRRIELRPVEHRQMPG